jgi:predicted nucleic-acid-binding protein
VIGLDTNVVVRYLAQDDPRQSAAATRVFERTLSSEKPGFVSVVTMCEVAWVLVDCYRADRDRIRAVIEGLLGSKQIQVQSAELVWKALRAWQGSAADFSDALIGELALSEGAAKTLTFDKAAAKLARFELLAQ